MSRILIFGSWMFVTCDGNFQPVETAVAFYTTFGIMALFNVVFNRTNIRGLKYWIGDDYFKYTYIRMKVM